MFDIRQTQFGKEEINLNALELKKKKKTNEKRFWFYKTEKHEPKLDFNTL